MFSFFAYALSSWGMFWHQSNAPHFVWQADAFLHGQLALRSQPPNLNDWVLESGRWYVSFPPFPAILMLPFVALWGLGLNDTVFTIVFASLNVALVYRLLRLFAETGEEIEDAGAGAAAKPASDHMWLALLFGFGTLAWSCAIRGEVWFTAETIGATLTLCYLLASVRARHPLAAGLALACATITRTPLAFSIVFFLLEALLAPANSSSNKIPRATARSHQAGASRSRPAPPCAPPHRSLRRSRSIAGRPADGLDELRALRQPHRVRPQPPLQQPGESTRSRATASSTTSTSSETSTRPSPSCRSSTSTRSASASIHTG